MQSDREFWRAAALSLALVAVSLVVGATGIWGLWWFFSWLFG